MLEVLPCLFCGSGVKNVPLVWMELSSHFPSARSRVQEMVWPKSNKFMHEITPVIDLGLAVLSWVDSMSCTKGNLTRRPSLQRGPQRQGEVLSMNHRRLSVSTRGSSSESCPGTRAEDLAYGPDLPPSAPALTLA